MLRQYGTQRFKPSLPMIPKKVGRGKSARTEYCPQDGDMGYKYRIGTVPIGTIVYIDESRGIGPKPNNPWIVEGWLNREYHPCVKGGRSTVYMRGGHLAVVRSLRDGRRKMLADYILIRSVDSGLTR